MRGSLILVRYSSVVRHRRKRRFFARDQEHDVIVALNTVLFHVAPEHSIGAAGQLSVGMAVNRMPS